MGKQKVLQRRQRGTRLKAMRRPLPRMRNRAVVRQPGAPQAPVTSASGAAPAMQASRHEPPPHLSSCALLDGFLKPGTDIIVDGLATACLLQRATECMAVTLPLCSGSAGEYRSGVVWIFDYVRSTHNATFEMAVILLCRFVAPTTCMTNGRLWRATRSLHWPPWIWSRRRPQPSTSLATFLP